MSDATWTGTVDISEKTESEIWDLSVTTGIDTVDKFETS